MNAAIAGFAVVQDRPHASKRYSSNGQRILCGLKPYYIGIKAAGKRAIPVVAQVRIRGNDSPAGRDRVSEGAVYEILWPIAKAGKENQEPGLVAVLCYHVGHGDRCRSQSHASRERRQDDSADYSRTFFHRRMVTEARIPTFQKGSSWISVWTSDCDSALTAQ